jgi:hypothetical protein
MSEGKFLAVMSVCCAAAEKVIYLVVAICGTAIASHHITSHGIASPWSCVVRPCCLVIAINYVAYAPSGRVV